MKSKVFNALSLLLKIVLVLIIITTSVFVFVTLSSKNEDGIPKLFGYSPIVIKSDSMKGTGSQNFQKGDLVVISTVNKSTLKEKDIITFWDFDIANGKKVLNTHRIQKIVASSSTPRYITKGDNNPIEDKDARSQSDIVGVYKFQVKGAGNVMDFLGSKWGFLFCMVLPLFLFFIWRLIKLVMAVVDYRKAQTTSAVNETENNAE